MVNEKYNVWILVIFLFLKTKNNETKINNKTKILFFMNSNNVQGFHSTLNKFAIRFTLNICVNNNRILFGKYGFITKPKIIPTKGYNNNFKSTFFENIFSEITNKIMINI